MGYAKEAAKRALTPVSRQQWQTNWGFNFLSLPNTRGTVLNMSRTSAEHLATSDLIIRAQAKALLGAELSCCLSSM
jgi:hypothetical protein